MASTEKDSSPSLKSTGPKAIPADSPLLRPSTPQSPGSRRARELQRDARKARNFRSSLERSGSRSRGGTPLRCGTPTSSKPGQELKFSIKPSVGGRKGWKIMPANQDNLEEPDPEILQRVIEMIHEMEFSGRAVPELITLKV